MVLLHLFKEKMWIAYSLIHCPTLPVNTYKILDKEIRNLQWEDLIWKVSSVHHGQSRTSPTIQHSGNVRNVSVFPSHLALTQLGVTRVPPYPRCVTGARSMCHNDKRHPLSLVTLPSCVWLELQPGHGACPTAAKGGGAKRWADQL